MISIIVIAKVGVFLILSKQLGIKCHDAKRTDKFEHAQYMFITRASIGNKLRKQSHLPAQASAISCASKGTYPRKRWQ